MTNVPGRDDIVLRLNTPEELFNVDPSRMLSATGRLVTGIEELVQQVTPLRFRPGLRATIVLPPDQAQPGTEERLRAAILRYCQLRLGHTDAARRTQRQEVVVAFGVGLVLFVLGVVFSFYFDRSSLPELLKLLIGDGVFVIVAWVGLWYPLDELVHYRRPLVRERRVLAAIQAMDVVLRVD